MDPTNNSRMKNCIEHCPLQRVPMSCHDIFNAVNKYCGFHNILHHQIPQRRGIPGPNQMIHLIARRAYELWEKDKNNLDIDNWLQAERELKWYYTQSQ
jgi:hypothetical protein